MLYLAAPGAVLAIEPRLTSRCPSTAGDWRGDGREREKNG